MQKLKQIIEKYEMCNHCDSQDLLAYDSLPSNPHDTISCICKECGNIQPIMYDKEYKSDIITRIIKNI